MGLLLPPTGTLLCDRYRLGPLIGRGGAAAVYRGTDEVLHATVAIKVLSPDGIMSHPRAGHLSFRAEAVSAMRLSHPRILRVYNYEFQVPWEFLIMEYVAGDNLARLLERHPRGRFGVLETLDIGLGCLDALATAHAEGVIHNDLTPANILLTHAGTVKLCDFGLAHVIARDEPGRIAAVGTPAFMSPERIGGRAGDARSDLYSLAATLYALGNGATLFGNDALAYHHHVHTPTPPSPHLPAAFHEMLRVATEKDPAARFQSAAEMAEALGAVRRMLGPPAPPELFDVADVADLQEEATEAVVWTVADEPSCEILIVEDSAAVRAAVRVRTPS